MRRLAYFQGEWGLPPRGFHFGPHRHMLKAERPAEQSRLRGACEGSPWGLRIGQRSKREKTGRASRCSSRPAVVLPPRAPGSASPRGAVVCSHAETLSAAPCTVGARWRLICCTCVRVCLRTPLNTYTHTHRDPPLLHRWKVSFFHQLLLKFVFALSTRCLRASHNAFPFSPHSHLDWKAKCGGKTGLQLLPFRSGLRKSLHVSSFSGKISVGSCCASHTSY